MKDDGSAPFNPGFQIFPAADAFLIEDKPTLREPAVTGKIHFSFGLASIRFRVTESATSPRTEE